MELFQNARYIWCAGYENVPNSYINCYETISVVRGKKYKLYITAHTDYALWVGNTLAAFGQYADYPEQVKIYDEVDITAFLSPGENELTITGYGQRIDTSTQRGAVSGILYVITEDDMDICHSSLETSISPHPCFESGDMELISVQLGYSFRYDATGKAALGKAVETAVLSSFAPRPVDKLVLKEACPMRMVAYGPFREKKPTNSIGARMQYAQLGFGERCQPDFDIGFPMVKEEDSDGTYILLDLGCETAGLLFLDLEASEDTELLIGWGEHLDDMRVRSSVTTRNFAAHLTAKAGRFTFINPHRRLGCRYLELHAYGNIKLYRCTILPTDYPVTDDIHFHCADQMHNAIYEVCKRTLLLCMHEHYEDCPWREQALYTMDSRNEMLCGYYTFRETRFAKASLRLIADSIRSDGFLELCSPARVSITIPCFSAIYMIQLWEYVLFSGDISFGREMLPVCERICAAFDKRKAENGLISLLPEKKYWNFYEWQDGLSGGIGLTENDLTYDLPLNAFVSMAYHCMAKLYAALELNDSKYTNAHNALNETCHRYFYDVDAGRYYTKICCTSGERFHLAQLTQSLAVCAGMCPETELDRVLHCLAYSEELLPVTISHSVFRYDALLLRPETYGRFVFNHVAEQFGSMLRQNATTFWETIEGTQDLSCSRCHAWSAIPAYLYFRYIIGLYPNAPGKIGDKAPLPAKQTGIYEAETDF